MGQEIELKFAVEPAATPPWLETLSELAGVYPLRSLPDGQESVEHVDIYFDTPDYSLLRTGSTLRLRRSGDLHRLTVKGLQIERSVGGLHTRLEIEETIEDPDMVFFPAEWPASLRAALTPALGDDLAPPLRAIVLLVQKRRKRLVDPADNAAPSFDGAALGEFSFDTTVVYEPSAAPRTLPTLAAARRVTQFHEVEVELLAEDGALLQPIAAWLAGQPGLRGVSTSKFERALRAISRHSRQQAPDVFGMQPAMPTAEACRVIWREQLLNVLLAEIGVRFSSDVEYIHQMRVAVRRARVAADLFGTYFREKQIRTYVRTLRKAGKLLGVVRDLDVALLRLERRPQLTTPELTARWRQQRAEAYARLMAWLSGPRWRSFIADFNRFCATSGQGVRSFPHEAGKPPVALSVCHVMPSLLFNRFAVVRSYESLFWDSAPVDYATLHALRIDCKYLRYTLEFSAHLLGSDGQVVIRKLKRLQNRLGDLNDAVVSCVMLEELADEGKIVRADRYLKAQRRTVEKLSARVPQDLETLVMPEMRRRLARALARI